LVDGGLAEVDAGGVVVQAVAEFGEGFLRGGGKDGEIPGVSAVFVDELVFEAGGVVLPVEFGAAGLGSEAEEFCDAGEGRGPGLFGTGGGVGGGFVSRGLEQEAGDDHGEEQDEDEDGEEDEAAALPGRRGGESESGMWAGMHHGLREGGGTSKGSALVSERVVSAARPEGMRTTRRKRS
jgi:hypothetical protein